MSLRYPFRRRSGQEKHYARKAEIEARKPEPPLKYPWLLMPACCLGDEE